VVTLATHWVAVWTRSRHEELVHSQLVGRDIEVFLPLFEAPSRRTDRRKMVELPVFPGYLFARIEPIQGHIVNATRGVVRVLGPTRSEYSVVPDEQVEAVRRMVESTLRIEPFPFLKVGTRVRVKNGPLRGVEGTLIERRKRFRLVVSVDLLQQAVAAEISAEQVEPV
jgi:transcription antitermination factor NusG